MLVVDIPVRESHTESGIEITCTTAVLQSVDREPGGHLFEWAGDCLESWVEETDGAGGDGCREALGGYAEDCGGGG